MLWTKAKRVGKFKQGKIFLKPGNSSLGLRLPLDRLAYVHPDKIDPDPERSPFEDLPPLASLASIKSNLKGRYRKQKNKSSSPKKEKNIPVQPKDLIRTALCVEERGGCIFIFLPPISHFDLPDI